MINWVVFIFSGVVIYGMVVGSLPFVPGSTEPSKRNALRKMLNKGLVEQHQSQMSHLTLGKSHVSSGGATAVNRASRFECGGTTLKSSITGKIITVYQFEIFETNLFYYSKIYYIFHSCTNSLLVKNWDGFA